MKKSEQALLMIAIAVAAMYFFSGRIYGPMNDGYKDTLKKHNSLVKDVNRLGGEPAGTEVVEKSIARLTPQVGELEERLGQLKGKEFIPTDRIDEAMVELDGVAVLNGLEVRQLQPCNKEELAAAERKMLTRLDRSCYRLQLAGDYLDLLNFFRECGELDYLLGFVGLKIDGVDDDGHVDAQLLLLI